MTILFCTTRDVMLKEKIRSMVIIISPIGTDVEKKPLLTQVRVDRQLNKIDF